MTEEDGQPAGAAAEQKPLTPGDIQQTLHWSDRWRKRLKEGSWLRKRFDVIYLPVEGPTKFTESHEDLVRRLTPPEKDGRPDEERTKEILDEAQAIYEEAEQRRDGAERRATTLQGAVAIAVSLLLAGGAFLADPSKMQGDGWRVALALALIVVTFCFVVAGARALATTSRIHVFHGPTATKILDRSEMPLAEARIELAAETLKDYGYNAKVAAWKVAHLRAAAEWFGRALIALLLFAVLVAAYVVFGPDQEPTNDERPAVKRTR